jgi:undecaprenyl diphosphate synthase
LIENEDSRDGLSYVGRVITPTFWPDFRKPQFCEALEEYARRHRRFGAV